MLKIAVFLFAFALFCFLAILFWQLGEDIDSTILSALFGALTIVFIFCAVLSCLALFGTVVATGGVNNDAGTY